jgi:hypothetical protein
MDGKNYIAGKWVEAIGGARFESRNPAKFDQVLGTVALSNREDADENRRTGSVEPVRRTGPVEPVELEQLEPLEPVEPGRTGATPQLLDLTI